MKTLNLYAILIVGVVSLFACKKSDDGSDAVSPSHDVNIKIGNNPFNPTSTKALTTSETVGYDILLTDNQTSINLSTNTKDAGTYVACNTCRVADNSKTFSGSLTTAQGEYTITSGTLVLSINSNGTVDVTFSFDAVNDNNNTLSITDGKVTNLGVSQVSEEVHFKTILQSKTWYITKYNYTLVSETSQSGEFVEDSTLAGITEVEGGKCNGITYRTWHLWNYYQAKFAESSIIGIYNLNEVEQRLDTSCVIYKTTTTKNITRNKDWSYNAGSKKLTVDFGNMLGEEDSDFETTYDIISYTPNKIVLEGTKENNLGQSFYGKIVLE